MRLLKLFTLVILLIAPIFMHAQKKGNITDALRKTALSHMAAGRYGEAIDQLNKIIAQNGQNPDGYYLRGQCFEKRQQYEYARLDYRRAISLQTDGTVRSKYLDDLNKMLNYWYSLLNKKIEGHKRDIAIDANKAYNYLEIGKSYKYMEIWDLSEEWYDKYLARDENASPDEIIRYTEVLAKTGSIVKGEKILKKYTDRYPNDWRLWSRYGYFTMWLSKFVIAKKAFEIALSFKPYFIEARDGLDKVTRQAYLTQEDPRAFEKEYPIDRYYRILRRNPNDLETRFKLVSELIKESRLEEAHQQLKIVGVANSADPRYIDQWKFVTNYRDSLYRKNLEDAKEILLVNQYDKEAVKTVANYYDYLQNYDSAMVVLDKFFEKYPDDPDRQLRFHYGKIAAWNREFDKAIVITDKLLQEDPNNIDYQLFRAQVSIWITRDLELADKYIDNYLRARPNNIDALVAKGSLVLLNKDYEKAQEFADKAKEIDANYTDVIKLQSNIDWQKLRAEEEKLYAILELGRQRVVDGDPAGGIQYYEEYFSKAEPNSLIRKEFGDVLFAAKQYTRAMDTFNEVLAQGANYDTQMQRAKLFYAIGDSLSAVREFKDLVRQDSLDFDANLYLGDSYAKIPEGDSARAVYNNLLENWSLDSTQVEIVKKRKSWLKITGINAIFESFPSRVGVAPSISYYTDNVSFKHFSAGTRVELGVTDFLSLGMSFFRSTMSAKKESLVDSIVTSIPNFTGERRFTIFKWNIFLQLHKNMSMGIGLGTGNSEGALAREDRDVFVRFFKRDTVSVGLIYQYSDAALLLFSPYLLDTRYFASLYKIDGFFRRGDLKISGNFQYIVVDDGNAGNDFNIRLGRYFYTDIAMGYEYAFSNYKYKTNFYYSPRNFESHSFWVENDLDKKDELRVSIGGKIGLIPQSTLIALEGHVDVEYKPISNLTISGKISIGNTSRDVSSYRYFSGQLSAYWTVF